MNKANKEKMEEIFLLKKKIVFQKMYDKLNRKISWKNIKQLKAKAKNLIISLNKEDNK